MDTKTIRKTFLEFFKENGHVITPSSSLIPEDASLLFTTAGMVPFKDIFTGKRAASFPRATSSQKCVRAGGKHNDLEQVGYTTRHHTFFEMLGNFSFGDYFKEEAISSAWTLLTKVLCLDATRLSVTVYHTDEESRLLWKKISGLPEERIYSIHTDDNFWSMGDTGPCGPCTEIFYDHGAHIPGGPPGSADADGDRFVELWNIVFMSYEKTLGEEGAILQKPLPRPSIDTGMGLERIAAVLQGVHDNFDTDVLKGLIQWCGELSKVSPQGDKKFSHRVIADHIRSITFLMADGLLPSNEGRGYVLRRIIRRALRHAHHLGCGVELLVSLVPILGDLMGEAYGELKTAQLAIESTLQQEGGRFSELLDRGLVFLEGWRKENASQNVPFPGEKAFQLYDTFGFPLDLTQDILKEDGIVVDEEGFQKAMEAQKARSRESWAGSGSKELGETWMALEKTVPATVFSGYDTLEGSSVIQALLKRQEDGCWATCQRLVAGEEGRVITERTPFYGESGGQIGDVGWIRTGAGGKMSVSDTHKRGPFIVHEGRMEQGELELGQLAELLVNEHHRREVRANHSATHLLHAALRTVLGSHVMQRGSLVSAEKLRFDFNHHKALTQEELHQVEGLVNHYIRENMPIQDQYMDQSDALALGAMALFGEKYEQRVRVISMGEVQASAEKVFSRELCGGTHAKRTGDIGLLKCISEGSVSAGVRRIEALTGARALQNFQTLQTQAKSLAEKLRCSATDLEKNVEDLVKKSLLAKKSQEGISVQWHKETFHGLAFWHGALTDGSFPAMKKALDTARKSLGRGVVWLTLSQKGKNSFLLGVEGLDKLDASVLAQELVGYLGSGQGGGRKDLAQGGGIEERFSDSSIVFLRNALEGLGRV